MKAMTVLFNTDNLCWYLLAQKTALIECSLLSQSSHSQVVAFFLLVFCCRYFEVNDMLQPLEVQC